MTWNFFLVIQVKRYLINKFQPEKIFWDLVSKQIYEGVSINNSPSSPGLLLNSKSEYKQEEVARVVLVRGLSQ